MSSTYYSRNTVTPTGMYADPTYEHLNKLENIISVLISIMSEDKICEMILMDRNIYELIKTPTENMTETYNMAINL